MICPSCYTMNENDSRFCKACGVSLTEDRQSNLVLNKKLISLLLWYTGFHVFGMTILVFVYKVIDPRSLSDDPDQLNAIYRLTDMIISVLDVIVLMGITLLLKGKARTIAMILLVIRSVLFVYYYFF